MSEDIMARADAPGSREPSPTVLAASGFDPSRECLTPETYYSTSQEDPRTLVIRLRFPFDIDDWASGSYAIADTPAGVDPLSDADRLRRYEERDVGQRRITDLVHDQAEVIGADCYRVMRECDARIGRDRVGYGIRHARWRRTRKGERPSPASGMQLREDGLPAEAEGLQPVPQATP